MEADSIEEKEEVLFSIDDEKYDDLREISLGVDLGANRKRVRQYNKRE